MNDENERILPRNNEKMSQLKETLGLPKPMTLTAANG